MISVEFNMNSVLIIRQILLAFISLIIICHSNIALSTGVTWSNEYSQPFSAFTSVGGGEATWEANFTPENLVGDIYGQLVARQIDIKGKVIGSGVYSTGQDTVSTIITTGEAKFTSFNLNEPTAHFGPQVEKVAITCFSQKKCSSNDFPTNFQIEHPISATYYTPLSQVDHIGKINGKLNVVSDFGAAEISGTIATSGTATVRYDYNLWTPSVETQKSLQTASDAFRGISFATSLFGTSIDLATITKPESLQDKLLLLNTLYNAAETGTSIFNNPLSTPVFSKQYADSLITNNLNFILGLVNPKTYESPFDMASEVAAGISSISSTAAVATAYLASDPPDPNYKVLLTDDTKDIYQIDLFTTQAGKSMGLVNNKLFQFSESVILATSSLEKYKGAMLANDFEFAKLQLENFKKFESQYKILMSELPQDIQNAKNELDALGLLSIRPDFVKLAGLFRELQTNPEFLGSFKKFISIYKPGVSIDEVALRNLKVDEFVSLFAESYETKSYAGELDAFSNNFATLSSGYSDVVNIPSVPLPASLPLMSSALALFGFCAVKRKIK